MEPHKAPETAPAKLPWASPLCATLIENCQPWRYLSAQAAADLRDCGWIKEAEAIDEVLRGLPTGPIQDHQPKLMDQQFDTCRKGAERIGTILAACLAGSTPPADQANGSEENSGANPTPEQPAADPNVKRKEILDGLEPADRKAYFSFHYVAIRLERQPKLLQDREAYDWLQENGIDASRDDVGELADYQRPLNFESWRRQLSEARKLLGEQKYIPRAGRATGRSIVAAKEIENQRGSDE